MAELASTNEDTFLESVWLGSWYNTRGFHLPKIQEMFLQRISNTNLEEVLRGCSTELDRVKFIKQYFDWVPVDKDLLGLKQYSKASKLSSKLREKANSEYKKRNMESALRGYNLALLFGPTEDPETTLAYGNRSAVLLELRQPKLALSDIDCALLNKCQCPENLRKKLNERRAKCEAMILKLNNSNNQAVLRNQGFFNLMSPSETIRCAEDFVKIDYSSYCGRKLVVTQAVSSGSVLLVEKPYATVLVNGLSWDVEHCYFCHKRIIAGIPCTNGSFATFCTNTCKDAADQSFHRFELGLLPYLHVHKMSEWERLTLRLITTAGPTTLYKLYKLQNSVANDDTPETTVYDSGYPQICGLISHGCRINDVSNIFKSLVLVQLLKEFSSFFSNLNLNSFEDSEFSVFVASLSLHHLESIPYNAISFSEIQPDNRSVSLSYATGVFPTLSLVNHSCTPNAIHVKRSEFCETSLISLKPLKPGEEITISYGPIFTLKNRLERRQELKDKYNFICQCEACKEDWKPVMSNPDGILNLSCDPCKGRDKCCNCLEKALALHSQIVKYESQLHEAHKMLKNSGSSGNILKVIQLLKPCLDFFGTFPPNYELTQVAQELFKKAMVAFAATC